MCWTADGGGVTSRLSRLLEGREGWRAPHKKTEMWGEEGAYAASKVIGEQICSCSENNDNIHEMESLNRLQSECAAA